MIKIVPNLEFKYETSDLTEAVKDYKFDGRDNFLKKLETYQAVFNCQYDMIWYPFDIQICFIEIVTSHNLDMFINLTPNGLEYVGNKVVYSQYNVLGMYICSTKIGDKMGVKVDFMLQRGLMSPILTIFLPTILINIVGRYPL